MGDVISIYNTGNELVANYEYDAWGNVVSIKDASGNVITDETNIAIINPIRYRGYYYDVETKLYYLQSRYYNPEIGRFLNSDSVSDSGAGILGYNTFIYCANNPVNASDPSGHIVISAILGKVLIGGLAGAVVGAVSDFACQLINNRGDIKSVDPSSVIKSAVIGGICGAISGGVGAAISNSGLSVIKKSVANVVIDGCINVAETTLNAICNKDTLGVGDYIYSFASGVASAAFGNIISEKIENLNISCFNALSNNEKKKILNLNDSGQHITRSMVRNGNYTSINTYQSYISSGTVISDTVGSSVMTIGFNLFENESM